MLSSTLRVTITPDTAAPRTANLSTTATVCLKEHRTGRQPDPGGGIIYHFLHAFVTVDTPFSQTTELPLLLQGRIQLQVCVRPLRLIHPHGQVCLHFYLLDQDRSHVEIVSGLVNDVTNRL